ncbi:MAG: ATP-binding protein [Stappiaceae bacterium]
MSEPHSVARLSPPSIVTRLLEGRWIIGCVSLFSVAGVYYWQVPLAVGALLIAAIVVLIGIGTRRQKRVAALAERRTQSAIWPDAGMKVTLDSMPNACFLVDRRGVVRYINKVAAADYSVIQPGDPLSFRLRAPSLHEALERVSEGGAAERINWSEKTPAEVWLEAHVSPVLMSKSRNSPQWLHPDLILISVQDFSEQRRLERMRADFVANASHELRTPLASLTGFIETLQGPAKSDEVARERFLGIMLEQANRMARLINDLLSLSRIELKSQIGPDEQADLVECICHVRDALAPLAAEYKVKILCDYEQKQALANGDRDELVQVIENLTENAVKYGSDGGKVVLSLNPSTGDAGQAQWSIGVRDFGPGIASEHLPRLTERFYRADVATSHELQGTGLGLAIVKHILNRHRARLTIESESGEGALFTVNINVIDSAATAQLNQ